MWSIVVRKSVPVIEIEAAQEYWFALPSPAVLRDDHSGNVLEPSPAAASPRLDQLRGDGCPGSRRRGADRVFVVSDDADLRRVSLSCAAVLHAKRGKNASATLSSSDRSHRTQSESYRAPYSVVEPSLPW